MEKQLLGAIKNNKTDEFLKILKSKGCPKDSTGYELLTAAIKFHRKRIVMALLDNPDCQKIKSKNTWKGLTPLHMAVTILDWSDVVEKLLEKGYGKADENFNYKYGTAMELAYNAGNVNNTVDVLLKHAIDNDIIETGYLHIACTRPNLEIVKKYLKSDSIVYSINSQVVFTLQSCTSCVKFEVGESIIFIFISCAVFLVSSYAVAFSGDVQKTRDRPISH